MDFENNKFEMLKQIAALDFTIIDLHLYLNTHPMDQEVLAQHNSCVMQAKMLKQNYERFFGPLNHTESASMYPWQWISEPWPWEYEANYKLN